MKIYVAASAARQLEARGVAAELRAMGAEVVSRWLTKEDVGYGVGTGPDAESAVMDLEDVVRADILVCLTGDTLTRGGRHSEVGIALAFGKRVYLLGGREQVFHQHPLCSVVGSVAEIPVTGCEGKGDNDVVRKLVWDGK